jgi:YfiH family protein
MDWRSAGDIRWLEAPLGAARVAFSTRLGGVSEGPFESLNLGVLTDDDGVSVAENRGRLAAALGLERERVAIARQVHGTDLIEHRHAQAPSPFARPGSPVAEADGHVLPPGADSVAALVFVADCLPVALAGPGGAAILHCGWRGLAAGILARGTEAVAASEAAIGPGIGACCYEVGAEVLAAFEDFGPDVARGNMLDLAGVARRQLALAGVRSVDVAGLCTSCDLELFFSHRRDGGVTGRQAGVVWPEGG